MILPRLLLILLGERDGHRHGQRSSEDDLDELLPALADLARTEARPMHRMPSFSLTPAHLVEVAQLIEDAHASGADGTVVVQGRDTLDEAAFILDLLVGSDAPVSVTVAPDSDAAGRNRSWANIRAAARAATSPEARGLGSLVVLDGAVYPARSLEMSHAPGGAAMGVPIGGLFGDHPRFWARVPRLPVFPTYGGPPRPVALLRWSMGDDGRRLGSLPMLGFAGAVIEAMGDGDVPDTAVAPLGELATRMPVVLASRGPGGGVFRHGRNASRLLDCGLIPAGQLSALKARLLLGFALRGGAGHAAAAAAFAPYDVIPPARQSVPPAPAKERFHG